MSATLDLDELESDARELDQGQLARIVVLLCQEVRSLRAKAEACPACEHRERLTAECDRLKLEVEGLREELRVERDCSAGVKMCPACEADARAALGAAK